LRAGCAQRVVIDVYEMLRHENSIYSVRDVYTVESRRQRDLSRSLAVADPKIKTAADAELGVTITTTRKAGCSASPALNQAV
jgi:hypothetical protein